MSAPAVSSRVAAAVRGVKWFSPSRSCRGAATGGSCARLRLRLCLKLSAIQEKAVVFLVQSRGPPAPPGAGVRPCWRVGWGSPTCSAARTVSRCLCSASRMAAAICGERGGGEAGGGAGTGGGAGGGGLPVGCAPPPAAGGRPAPAPARGRTARTPRPVPGPAPAAPPPPDAPARTAPSPGGARACGATVSAAALAPLPSLPPR